MVHLSLGCHCDSLLMWAAGGSLPHTVKYSVLSMVLKESIPALKHQALLLVISLPRVFFSLYDVFAVMHCSVLITIIYLRSKKNWPSYFVDC